MHTPLECTMQRFLLIMRPAVMLTRHAWPDPCAERPSTRLEPGFVTQN